MAAEASDDDDDDEEEEEEEDSEDDDDDDEDDDNHKNGCVGNEDFNHGSRILEDPVEKEVADTEAATVLPVVRIDLAITGDIEQETEVQARIH